MKKATDLLRDLGGLIVAIRVSRGLSQAALAEAVHISRYQQCKHEHGSVEMPVSRLMAYCSAFKMPLGQFMAQLSRKSGNPN